MHFVPIVYINDVLLERVVSYKYLGVTIGEKLKCDAHIEILLLNSLDLAEFHSNWESFCHRYLLIVFTLPYNQSYNPNWAMTCFPGVLPYIHLNLFAENET